VRLSCLVLLVGCGRFGFDATTTGDAQTTLPDGEVVGEFENLTLPPGGEAISLAVAGSFDKYYVGYTGGRVFRVDAGVFTECAPLVGRPNDMSLASDGKLYVLRDDNVSVSTDSCASWTDLAVPRGAYAIAATATGAVAGTYDGVWVYAATTWSRLVSPFDGVLVRSVSVAADGRIGAGGDSGFGVYRANTWHFTATTNAFGYQVAFDPNDSTIVWSATETGLYRSTTSGDTFTLVRPDFGDMIAIDPADSNHMIMMTGGALEQTVDGAMTWQSDVRTPPLGNVWVNAAVFDPQKSGRVVVASESGIFTASTSALAWSRLDTMVSAHDIYGVAEVGTTRYIGTSAGLWVSESNAPWQLRADAIAQSAIVYDISLGATNPDRVYVAGDALARSNDRAESFSVLLPSSQIDGWSFRAIVERAGRVYSGSYARVAYSDNDGASWTGVQLGGAGHVVFAIAPRAIGNDVVVATDAGIFWSTDNGASFTASNTGLSNTDDIRAVTETPDGTLVMGGTLDGVWAKPNMAATWTRAGLAGITIRDLEKTPSGVVAATYAGVFITRDNGATWTEIAGLADRWPRTVTAGVSNSILVGTESHGLYRASL
jgi:hypothetical protein